jgi:hypothetical protein
MSETKKGWSEMNANELVEFTQRCLDNGELEKAAEQYRSLPEDYDHTTESATLMVAFLIYDLEKEGQEVSFFEGRSTIPEIMACHNQLTFYLRRFDFDVHYDTTEFVNFVKSNHISSIAMVCITTMAMIHQVKVLNDAAMTLFNSNEVILALQILASASSLAEDDTTFFNLAYVLCECGEYESAREVVNQIKTETLSVVQLKTRIQEKLS